MDDAELLVELATIDEVEARIPTSYEHDTGVYPPWCEVDLRIKREPDPHPVNGPGSWPMNHRMALRRHDGELIMQVLWDVLHPGHKLGAVDQLHYQLDRVYDKIMKRVNKGKEPLPVHVGEARGLATAIALLTNPVNPDIDEVRAVAAERYEARR